MQPKTPHHARQRARVQRLIRWGVMASVLAVVGYSLVRVGWAGRTNSWPHTTCTIADTRVVRVDSAFKRDTPIIMYHGEYQLLYAVKGQEYRIWKRSGWFDVDRQFIERKMSEPRTSCPYDIQFNPRNPAEAVAHLND